MGYRVIYDDEKRTKGNSFRFRLIPLTAAAWLAFLALVNAYWPQGQAILRQILLPEKVETAVQAFYDFSDNLQSGQTFPEAWELFYDEVVH